MNSSDSHNYDKHLSSYKEDFSPDVEAGLRRLHGQIGADARPQAKVRRLSRRSLFSIAAALLLLISTGFLIFIGDGSTHFENSTSEPMAISLPDGTKVLLQQGAKLSYGADYNETDRLIDLQGQAYFEVDKNASRPFLVNTSETELRVTGTAFNLRVEGEELEVEVSEGSIELHRNGEVVPVKVKERGLAVSGKASVVMTAKDLNRHAWRTGILRFDSTPLNEVFKTISNNYGFIVDFPEDCDLPYSGNFSVEDPISILESIAELWEGELVVVDEASKSFKISRLNCE